MGSDHIKPVPQRGIEWNGLDLDHCVGPDGRRGSDPVGMLRRRIGDRRQRLDHRQRHVCELAGHLADRLGGYVPRQYAAERARLVDPRRDRVRRPRLYQRAAARRLRGLTIQMSGNRARISRSIMNTATVAPGAFGGGHVATGSNDGLYQADLWANNIGYNDQSYLLYLSKIGEQYLTCSGISRRISTARPRRRPMSASGRTISPCPRKSEPRSSCSEQGSFTRPTLASSAIPHRSTIAGRRRKPGTSTSIIRT